MRSFLQKQKAILFILLLSLTNGFYAFSQTNVSGIISADSTFRLSASPFVVTGNLILDSGYTLTVEPGVVIKFNQHTSILIRGVFHVNKTGGAAVTFTANTNTPTSGYWGGISFAANATAPVYDVNGNYVSGSILNKVNISYAGSSLSGVFGAVAMTGAGAPYMRDITISNCAYPGVYARSSTSSIYMRRASIQNCQANTSAGSYVNNGAGVNIRLSTGKILIDSSIISQNTGAGVAVLNSGSAPIQISNSIIENNTNTVTGNGGGLYVDAHAKIFYNQILNNSAVVGSGIFGDTALLAGGSIHHNILYKNQSNVGAAFYGSSDSLYANIFSYNTGTSSIVASYRAQYNYFNQYNNNNAPVILHRFGPYVGGTISRNTFSNNATSSGSSALMRISVAPTTMVQNNLQDNKGFTYMVEMQNNDNTAIVSAANTFWKTAVVLNLAQVQAQVYDVNDNLNQGQVTLMPINGLPRTDCPISAVVSPIKTFVGDSLLVRWNKKSGENTLGYKVYYGGTDGVMFAKSIITTDTFCRISALENLDSVAVAAYKTTATQTYTDFATGAMSWYTFAAFQDVANPTITSFTPKVGKYNTLVNIFGTNFGGVSQASFGGTNSSVFVANTSSNISAVVERGSSGNVRITTPNGSATLSGFEYIPAPTIFGFSPGSGSEGSIIDIYGVNFSGTSSVTFGGTSVQTFNILDDTLIRVTLGNGNPGYIVVTNPFGSDSIDGFIFCVPFSLNFSDTTHICGDRGFLEVSGGPYNSYEWSTGETVSRIEVTTPGTYTIAVIDVNGCAGYDTTEVFLNPIPQPVISGRDTVCEFQTYTYNVGIDPGHVYTWRVSGGSITSGQGSTILNVKWGAFGKGSLAITDSVSFSGCKTTATIDTVFIFQVPAPSIVGEDTVCSGSITGYKTSKAAGHYYTWSLSGGTIVSGQGTDSISVLWSSPTIRNMTVTDSVIATGCKGISAPLAISIFATPTPLISGTNTLCGNTSATYSTPLITGRTYTWTVVGGVIVSGQGTFRVSVLWNNDVSSGTLSVVDSVNATGCKAKSPDFIVTINTTPTPVISGTDTACVNTVYSYTTPKNTGRIYLWTISGGTIVTGQATDSIRVNWTSVGTGTLIVKDSVAATGCKATTAAFSVVKLANPTPVISGTNALCAGSSASYKTPKLSGHLYNWLITGGTIVAGQGTDSIFVTWGTGTFGTLRVTDSVEVTGCKTTTSNFIVSINPIPVPVISGSNSVCEGGTEVYTTPLNTGRNYLWSATGGNITSGQGTSTIVVVWSGVGFGTLTVRDSVNSTGCKATTAPYAVSINPVPTPVISGLVNVCENSIINYSSPSNTGRSYRWVVTGGTIAGGQGSASINIQWGSAGVGSIILTDSVNGSGCKTTTIPYNVSINSAPKPKVSGLQDVCAGASVSYTTPFNTGRTYTWNVSGGSIVSGQGSSTVTIAWGIAGAGTVTVTDSIDGAGCKGTTAPYAVTVNASPAPVVSGATTACSGGNFVYSTPATTGNTYTWNITNGTILSGQGTSNVIVSWTSIGLGTISVTDSLTGTGCKTTSAVVNVSINAGPDPVITGASAVCSNSQAIYSTPANPGRTYTWTVTGGTIFTGQGTDAITVDWGIAGSGSLTVTDSIDASGCKVTTPIFNVVIGNKSTPIISGATFLCENSRAQYGTINAANRYFNWTAVGGTVTSGQGSSSVQIDWGTAGVGVVILNDSTIGAACVGTSSKSVTLNPTPVGTFTTQTSGGNVTFIPDQTGLSYLWDFGDATTSNSSYPTHTYAANGTYTVVLNVTSTAGCVSNSSQDINLTTVGLLASELPHFGVKAYPNPFNGATNIGFTLPNNAQVSVEVYDVTGRLVQSLVQNENLGRGEHQYVFQANGNASAMYVLQLKVNDQISHIRLVQTER